MYPPLTPPQSVSIELSDGYVCFARYWPPAQPASAATLYLHGIQSHGGWYEWSASAIAAETGGAVLMPDRRGSGRNPAPRGDVARAGRWIADVAELTAWLQRKSGATSINCAGVSWGGKLAAAYCQRKSPEAPQFASLLLIAPGMFPQVDLKWFEKLGVGIALIREPSAPFKLPLQEPELFTDNPAGQRFIADDNLKLTHCTARFLIESRGLDRRLQRATRADWLPPTTLLLAEDDRIIRSKITAAWLERVATRPSRIVYFAGSAHTLEFAADRQQFAAELRHWAAKLPRHGG
ncbi:MAG: alpha/beta fold hydrolase [Phycisphaerae bacterium]|nr:alpha/beta fold hydrolase [Phycisphaerae bacterium]